MKWDPVRVAADMEMLTCNGDYVFHHDELLTPTQIKSYFSRLSVKQRSMQQTFSQQMLTNTPSSSSSSMRTTDINSVKSNQTIDLDEPDDLENVDDRDLYVYSWRQIVDQARDILDQSTTTANSSSSFTTSYSSPTEDASLEKKIK